MYKAEIGHEIEVRALNEVGVLTGIAHVIADHGISILSVSCWVEGMTGVIHLVTDDNLRAKDALAKKGYKVAEGKILTVELPHKPGMLKHMTEKLKAAGIDIVHLFATALAKDKKCLVVLSTSDNDKAMVTLNR